MVLLNNSSNINVYNNGGTSSSAYPPLQPCGTAVVPASISSGGGTIVAPSFSSISSVTGAPVSVFSMSPPARYDESPNTPTRKTCADLGQAYQTQAQDQELFRSNSARHSLSNSYGGVRAGVTSSSHTRTHCSSNITAGTMVPAAPSTVPLQEDTHTPQLQVSVASATGPSFVRRADDSTGERSKPRVLVPRHPLERPTVALAFNIMIVYKKINLKFCNERRSSMLGTKYNEGYDDREGHYISIIGEEIAGRYTVQEVLGKGSFGIVLRCCDEKYQEPVALKIIRNGAYFRAQGCLEAEIVAYLNKNPALVNLVVQLRKAFIWQGHIVLVFDLLSFNLYQLIRCTRFNGMSLDLTRKFTFQLLQVLLQLERHDPPIIHCDLKPENVVLRDRSRSGIRVIDFGSSCYQQVRHWVLPPPRVPYLYSQVHTQSTTSSGTALAKDPCLFPSSTLRHGGERRELMASTEAGHCASIEPRAQAQEAAHFGTPRTQTHCFGDGKSDNGGHQPTVAAPKHMDVCVGDDNVNINNSNFMPKYIQSRFYRSPEVILELGYTTAIDRWSLGCMLVELHTGVPLFSGKNEADMIAYFTAILGPLPDAMIASSPKFSNFYHYIYFREGARPGMELRDEESEKCETLPRRWNFPLSHSDWGLVSFPAAGDSKLGVVHEKEHASGAEEKQPVSRQGFLPQPQAPIKSSIASAAPLATKAINRSLHTRPEACSLAQAALACAPPHARPTWPGKTAGRGAGGSGNSATLGHSTLAPPSTEAATVAEGEGRAPSPASNLGVYDRGSGDEPSIACVASQGTRSQSQSRDGLQAESAQGVPRAAVSNAPPAIASTGVCEGHRHPQQPYSCFKLKQKPNPQWCRPLEDIIGVYTGGPRGCRRGQPGHELTVYKFFLDFIKRLLEYDPRKRMSCAEAIRHPFLAPLVEMEAKAAAAAAAAAQQQ